jgi:hypothetical protein
VWKGYACPSLFRLYFWVFEFSFVALSLNFELNVMLILILMLGLGYCVGAALHPFVVSFLVSSTVVKVASGFDVRRDLVQGSLVDGFD